MDRSEQKIFPPLWIWMLLFFCSLFFAGFLVHVHSAQTQYEFDSRASYLIRGFASAKRKPVVLVIGTSLVEFGLDSSKKIEECIREYAGRSIVLLKVFKSGARLSEIMSHMKSLRQVHPDFVVVEANMLFYRPSQEFLLSKWTYLLHQWIEGATLYHPYIPDSSPSMKTTGKLIDENRNGLIDTSDISSFRDLAASWQSKGTRFLFLNFPIEKSKEFKKWNGPDTSSFSTNMRFLKEKINLDYVNAGLELDSSFFYDERHMNPKGRNIFFSSFCKALAIQLKSL